jgi:hypothetical protein
MGKGAKRKWTLEKIQEEANKHKTRGDFQALSPKAYWAALRYKCIDLVCSNMPKHVDMSGENNPAFRWTFDMLKAEALKHKTRRELEINNPSVYNIILKRDDSDTILQHMPKHVSMAGENNPNFKWTDEYLASIALKYPNKREFYKKDRNFFGIACKRRIIDKICSHMVEVSRSYMELDLLLKVRETFPSAKKIRDCKVQIENKPYIKGFEIDIYIPELKLGIEFDGTWWHSFEYMRACKRKTKWSDDDILNYHKIKDAWFATKGIEILHIKEEDWIQDEQACIQKCLDFLNLRPQSQKPSEPRL